MPGVRLQIAAVVAILVLLGVASWATFTGPDREGLDCGRWPDPGWTMAEVEDTAQQHTFWTGQDNSELLKAFQMCDGALETRKRVAIGSAVGVAVVPFATAFFLYRRPSKNAAPESS